MKKYVLFIVTCFILFSCTKDSTTTGHLTTYRLEGLSDITLNSSNNNRSSFILTFNQEGNINETISISFSGLPAGVTIDTNYAKSGKPDFSSYITFINDGTAANGTYAVTLHCVGSISGDRTFNFQIIVTQSGTVDCIDQLKGLWTTCSDNYMTIDSPHSYYGYYYQCYITIDSTGGNKKVIFSNGIGNGTLLEAYINCSTDSLIFPLQPNNISGAGKFSSNLISYTIQDGYYIYSVSLSR
jgi:hypothetical protein